MIDVNKKYVTRSGGIITNLEYKSKIGEITMPGFVAAHRKASSGIATFPIKGTILESGHRPRYQIWTEDGRADVLKDHPDDFDLSKTVIEKRYRPATCFDCNHEWKWVVEYSSTTQNLSGEKNVYCEKCGGRNIMTERIKTIYITEKKVN